MTKLNKHFFSFCSHICNRIKHVKIPHLDAVSTNGDCFKIIDPDDLAGSFGTITLRDANGTRSTAVVYSKREHAHNAYRQLVGHALLETVGLPVAKIYVAKQSEGQTDYAQELSRSRRKVFSIEAYKECGNFRFREDAFHKYLHDYPKTSADMLCALMVSDDNDDCHNQIVYNLRDPKQAVRVDVQAGGGFDDNFRHLSEAYGSIICTMRNGDYALEDTYCKTLAQASDPQRVLDRMLHVEKTLTDSKLSYIMENLESAVITVGMKQSDHQHEVCWTRTINSVMHVVKRNRDNWREIIKVNSPELHRKIVALETSQKQLPCFEKGLNSWPQP